MVDADCDMGLRVNPASSPAPTDLPTRPGSDRLATGLHLDQPGGPQPLSEHLRNTLHD